MEVTLTLTVQTIIKAKNDSDYEKKRDNLIIELEELGFDVNIETEEED
jgi:predicted amino acid-binding ACT domain protein